MVCHMYVPGGKKGSVKMCHYLSSTQIFEWYVIKVVSCLHSAVHWSAYSTLLFLKNTTTTMSDGVHVYYCHCLCLIQKWKSPGSQWILTMSRRLLRMVAVSWTFLLTFFFLSDLTYYLMILLVLFLPSSQCNECLYFLFWSFSPQFPIFVHLIC